jgi:hypothetical protein
MENLNLSTPKAVMLDQFQWASEAVLPAFERK